MLTIFLNYIEIVVKLVFIGIGTFCFASFKTKLVVFFFNSNVVLFFFFMNQFISQSGTVSRTMFKFPSTKYFHESILFLDNCY